MSKIRYFRIWLKMTAAIQFGSRGVKAGLVTGGARDVGLHTGLALARRLPPGSIVYLTVRQPSHIPHLTAQLQEDQPPNLAAKLKFIHLDFHVMECIHRLKSKCLVLQDKNSLIKLYQVVKQEVATLDILVNNSQKYHLPALLDDKTFAWQCEDTLAVNYHGLKKMCKAFSPMMNRGGRIVNCSSHLGHLSNLDGQEPRASKLRAAFAAADLAEEELDRLVAEFGRLAGSSGGGWWQHGWPACPYTVSKIAVNA